MLAKQVKPRVSTVKMRDSNIELFRIIAMLLIVAHHYVVNSGLTGDGLIFDNPTSRASLFLLIWGAFGKIGINCFVLITGYFMCQSKISAKKFAKLLFEVMFYKIVINSIFWITGYAPFTIRAFFKGVIPFTSVAQNFTGTYLLFFLCIPFLNVLIHNLSEKQHVRLLVLSGFIYVFFGTVPFFSVKMNYISWYIVLYFTASYIRLYPKKIFTNSKGWGILAAACVFLCCASVGCGAFVKERFGVDVVYYFVTDSNAFLAFLTGISAFMFFKNLKIKHNKFINSVSSTTFGVLLIHANSDTMRQWLWQDVLKNVKMYRSDWVYVHAILSVVAVFLVCSLIDLARIRLVEAPFFRLWDKHYEKIFVKYQAWEDRLCQKLKISNAKVGMQ